jgi:glycosyltransferase involved in cell wall biosynthesis
LYRALQRQHGVPVTVIYASNFSVAGYHDSEFGRSFAWDTDLLSGYRSFFLTKVNRGAARSQDKVSAHSLGRALSFAGDGPVLLLGYSPHFHRAALFHAWRSRRLILFRAETTDHARTRGTLKRAVRDYLLRRLYSACTRLLYVGERSHRHFLRLGVSEDRLTFSPYCVDTSAFCFAEDSREQLRHIARVELNAGPSDQVLLFSGKLSVRKGPDLLIAAVESLPRSVRDRTIVVFLGDGELRGELTTKSGHFRMRFCGFKNQTELSPYYHAADLLVLPSRHSETWGLVVNEALHHGLPGVVSQAVGCTPDLIEPGVTGEIAETNSVEGLAAAILRALPLVGRAEIRHACRERVGGYTIEKAAEGIAHAYRAVVN